MAKYNLYAVLDVTRDASDAAIRSAYRRRALDTHPDKGGRADVFRDVVSAFETLSDVVRRGKYDESLRVSGSRDGLGTLATSEDRSRDKRKDAPVSTPDAIPTPESAVAGEGASQNPPKLLRHDRRSRAGVTRSAVEANTPVCEDTNVSTNVSRLWEEITTCPEEACQKRVADLSFRSLEALLAFFAATRTPTCGRKNHNARKPVAVRLALEEALGNTSETASSECENEGDDELHATIALAICDEPCDDANSQASATEPPRQRGIHYAHGRRDYVACIGWRGFYVITQCTRHLDSAVDWHILLVRFRQIAVANEATSATFEEAVRGALVSTLQERSGEGSTPAPRLYFSYIFWVKGKITTPSTLELETALEHRRRILALKADGKHRDDFIMEKKCMSAALKEERRGTRNILQAEKHAEKLEKKHAEKLAGRARRNAKKTRLRWTLGLLRAQLRLLRREFKWASGAPADIDAVEGMDLVGTGRVIYVYVELKVCRGPLRTSLNEAFVDRLTLRRALESHGEAAAISEAERLDLEAAAARFVALL